jgi:hypothetical protein
METLYRLTSILPLAILMCSNSILQWPPYLLSLGGAPGAELPL